jgi:hypothetical protein
MSLRPPVAQSKQERIWNAAESGDKDKLWRALQGATVKDLSFEKRAEVSYISK